MKVAVFSAKPYDREFLNQENDEHGHEIWYLEARLAPETAAFASGCDAVCVFVNDTLDRPTLEKLKEGGVRVVALRCAGFNNVDVQAAADLGITVARVPAYSPHAVAEHTLGLMLTLNRKFHKAYARVREGNFSLDGLLGFDLQGKTAGVVGTGEIGAVVAGLLKGLGCRVLAMDPKENPDVTNMGIPYKSFSELCREADVITLHCPLTPATHHLIDAQAIESMKRGVMLINTSRGAVVDTQAVIQGLKAGKVGYFGLDVYEEEGDVFFEDLSSRVIEDDVLARLMTFPNVVMTSHQAFFTREAMSKIASTTMDNLTKAGRGEVTGREVTPSGRSD